MIDDLNALTDFHSKNCKIYADYIESYFTNSLSQKLEELPFVPVRAFKNFDLYSIPDDQIYKIMMSSGTSGSQSKIVLYKHTDKNQTNALIEIFGENFGKARSCSSSGQQCKKCIEVCW